MDDAYEWIGTREAAARLGVSPSTVERLVRRGELVAERVERPGGSRLLIRFNRPQEPRQAASGDAGHSEAPAPSEPPQEPPAAITGLLEIVAADRETMERQADRIAALEREAGMLTGRLAAAETRADQYAFDLMEQTERAVKAETHAADIAERLRLAEERLACRPWWRFWE